MTDKTENIATSRSINQRNKKRSSNFHNRFVSNEMHFPVEWISGYKCKQRRQLSYFWRGILMPALDFPFWFVRCQQTFCIQLRRLNFNYLFLWFPISLEVFCAKTNEKKINLVICKFFWARWNDSHKAFFSIIKHCNVHFRSFVSHQPFINYHNESTKLIVD